MSTKSILTLIFRILDFNVTLPGARYRDVPATGRTCAKTAAMFARTSATSKPR